VGNNIGNGNIAQDTRTKEKSCEEGEKRPRHAMRVQIEEIEDEYWALEASMPKAIVGLIEDAESEEDAADSEIGEEVEGEIQKEAEVIVRAPLPPPPEEPDLIIIPPRRNPKSGDSALGVSVLSVKGWIGSLDDAVVDLRLDSCADITLISEETHAALIHPPRIRQGHRMSLAQLTDKGTTIKGYTKLPIIMRTTTGELIMLEAEAYVVKGMTVPILLGEDFQINYELGVSRNVETGSKIIWRNLTAAGRKLGARSQEFPESGRTLGAVFPRMRKIEEQECTSGTLEALSRITKARFTWEGPPKKEKQSRKRRTTGPRPPPCQTIRSTPLKRWKNYWTLDRCRRNSDQRLGRCSGGE
jgi:hypothetical protein